MIQEAESFSPQKEQMLQNVTIRHNDDKENWGRIPHGLSHKHKVAKMGQRNSMSPSNETRISFRNELQLSSPARRVPLTAPRRDIVNLPVDTPTRMKRKGERLEMNVKLPRPDSNRSSVDFWIDGKENAETDDVEAENKESKNVEVEPMTSEPMETENEATERLETANLETEILENNKTQPEETLDLGNEDQTLQNETENVEEGVTVQNDEVEEAIDNRVEEETNREHELPDFVQGTIVQNVVEETVQDELPPRDDMTDALNQIESQFSMSLSSLKEQLDLKKDTITTLLNEKACLVCHVSQLENLLKDTQYDLSQSNQMETLKDTISASLLRKSNLQNEIARLSDELSNKQELLDDCQSHLKDAHQDVAQLQQDLFSSRDNQTRLANELNLMVSENGELNGQLSNVQEKLNNQTTALDDLREQVEIKWAENEQLALQTQEYQIKLSSFDGKRVFTNEEIALHEDAMKALELENQQLKDAHNEVIARLESSHREETSLLKESHNDEIAQLEASYNSEISVLKESHSKEVSSLKEKSRAPHDDKQVGELRSQIKHLNNELRSQESETESKLQQLSQDLYVQYSAKHEQKVAILKKGYEQKWSNKISKMESEIEKLTSQFESAKRKLSAERDEKARLVKLWDELVDIERSSKKRPQVSGIDYESDSGDF